jgi:hypothetical protein
MRSHATSVPASILFPTRSMSLRRTPRLVLALLLASAGACAPAAPAVAPHPVPAVTRAGAVAMVRDELYFGRRMRDGRIVSEAEWSAFVDSVVTPRFPKGLTVLDAYGQWLGDGDTVVREPTKVLLLLHPGAAEEDHAIREIITRYKERFAQESVLRVTTTAAVEF